MRYLTRVATWTQGLGYTSCYISYEISPHTDQAHIFFGKDYFCARFLGLGTIHDTSLESQQVELNWWSCILSLTWSTNKPASFFRPNQSAPVLLVSWKKWKYHPASKNLLLYSLTAWRYVFFFLITQHGVPFINASETTESSQGRAENGKRTP